MNDLLKLTSEIVGSINNTSNVTNIQNQTWKNPEQVQQNKIEQIHQQFLKAQEWGNSLNQENATEVSTTENQPKKRSKRGIDGGNEIEYYSRSSINPAEIYPSFKPEFWEEIVYLYFKYHNREDFSNKFTDKVYSGVWMDYRLDKNDIKYSGNIIYNNFWTIENTFINSSRRERIRIVIEHDIYSAGLHHPGFSFKSVNIRTDDKNYYPNKYLDNLKRDFPDWNSYKTINLGIINDNYIKNAIKQKYPNFDISKISIVDKVDYSHFCACFLAKTYLSDSNSNYSYGNLRPTFSYIIQTKINEISDIITNNTLVKNWTDHIKYWSGTLTNRTASLNVVYQHLKDTYSPGKELDDKINIKKQAFKINEKIQLDNFKRDWSYADEFIKQNFKLDELNKNVQGIKEDFESINKTVNELGERITNLENPLIKCSNGHPVSNLATTVSAPIPIVGQIMSLIDNGIKGVCAIAGI